MDILTFLEINTVVFSGCGSSKPTAKLLSRRALRKKLLRRGLSQDEINQYLKIKHYPDAEQAHNPKRQAKKAKRKGGL